LLLTRADDALVARGLLVSVRYQPGGGDDPDKIIGAHHLAFTPAFMRWLDDRCPFWPPALHGKRCP
jgi:hypothetical protein